MAKPKKSSPRLARGRKRLREIHGAGGEAVVAGIAQIAPDLAQ
jgi:hypothetical protein